MESDQRMTLAAAFRISLDYATDGLFRVFLTHQPGDVSQTPAALRRIAQGIMLGLQGMLQTGVSHAGFLEEIGARLHDVTDGSDDAMIAVFVYLEESLRLQIPSRFHDMMRTPVNTALAHLMRGWMARSQLTSSARRDLIADARERLDGPVPDGTLQEYFAQSPIATSILDLQAMQYVVYNPALERLFGFTLEEALALSIHETRNDDTVDDDFGLVAELVAGTIPFLERVSARPHKDGHSVPYRLLSWLIRDGDGTARHMASQLVAMAPSEDGTGAGLAEKRARFLYQLSADPILITTADGIVRYASPSVEVAFGHDPNWLVGQHVQVLVSPQSYPDGQRMLEEVAAMPRSRRMAELEAAVGDGSSRWFEVIAINLLDVEDVQGIVLQGRDITERRELHDQLELAVRTEPLTGLLNRRGFLARFSAWIAQHRDDERAVLLAGYIDLDDFKQINDRFGHIAGDIVLSHVGHTLADLLGEDGFAGRMGGDEFVICMRLASERAIADFAGLLSRALTGSIAVDGEQIAYAGTFGLVRIDTRDERDADHWLGEADRALFRAKIAGTRGIVDS